MSRTPRLAAVAAALVVITLAAGVGAPSGATKDGSAPTLTALSGDSVAARALLVSGRYAEARRAYERLAATSPEVAAVGMARSREATGDRDGARRDLRAAIGRLPRGAAARAELARLEFERGSHDSARALAREAIGLDPDQPVARWVDAELHRVAGRLDSADVAYRWFVRRYNRERGTVADPELLRWIGLGAAQYARWNRNSGQFHFLVNTLYPDALKRDPTYWPARLEAARLFIEKYNRRDAIAEIDAGLALNPNAAELHAAWALIAFQQFELDSARAGIDRALALDPGLLEAHRLRADVELVAGTPRDAIALLERARALNPRDETTLGRLGAAYGALDGTARKPKGRLAALIAEVTARNPKPGEFYAALGGGFDLMRRYPHAATWYEEARRVMPQLVAAHGQLGMVRMRLGEEAAAREVLKEAMEADPFNVRVDNTLDVLEVLDGYRTIETDHFVIRFDPAHDSLLARYAARYLEDEVHPEVVKTLGYAPPEKSLFEIFGPAQDQNGHAWFSTRMVGLPFIGTVGACAGRMVALTSPNDGRPFHWARVLKHEFVHVVNLQQTDFALPHWFTEALAVRLEGPGRPRAWDQVLARRLEAGTLFDLGTINLGFVRPRSGDDWTLAYCQSELYARYMVDTYGADALAKMLAAYADRLDTGAALRRAFGVELPAFESGYRAYVERLTGRRHGAAASAKPAAETATDLERHVRAHPRDAAAAARLARIHLEREQWKEARAAAAAALAADSTEQSAAWVLARVQLEAGDHRDSARAVLRRAVGTNPRVVEALALLANLAIESDDWEEGERASRLGIARFPLDAEWERGLAAALRGAGRKDSLAVTLARVAERDHDDVALRLELAKLARDRKDFTAAARWALDALYVDVKNAEAHALRAEALSERGQTPAAIEEWEIALSLAPDTHDWRLGLARAHVAEGDKARARAVLDELLRRAPDHRAGQEMRRSL